MTRITKNVTLTHKAQAILDAAAEQEPLFAQAWNTPQTPPFHAEGPFVSDHVRRILTTIFAVTEEQFHFIDIEEVRGMKGYEGEWDEMEEVIKEYPNVCILFALCHDAAKGACMYMRAMPGSKAEQYGFRQTSGVEQKQYRQWFAEEAARDAQATPQQIQARVYDTFGIRAHYPGHDRRMSAPEFASLFDRLCKAYELTPRDRSMLNDIIARHLRPLADFTHDANPARMEPYAALARDRGYDEDDFFDLFQTMLFLDAVAGSQRYDRGRWFSDLTVVANFLRAEHDWAPWKRQQRMAAREEQKQKQRQIWLREVGLDGTGLMEVVKMQPGPALGKLLQQVQAAVLGSGPWPELPAKAKELLQARAEHYYERAFEKET